MMRDLKLLAIALTKKKNPSLKTHYAAMAVKKFILLYIASGYTYWYTPLEGNLAVSIKCM